MSTKQLNDSLLDGSHYTRCAFTLHDDADTGHIMSILLLNYFVVSLPANVWVVWLICRGTREVFASEICLLSLAVCEILYCVVVPAQLYCMFNFEHVSDGLAILLTVQWPLLWVGRPIFQSCICVERYIAVVHPLIFIR